MVTLAFYRGPPRGLWGLFTRAIRWWTSGPYSHVEVILATPKGTLWATSDAAEGGVVLRIKGDTIPGEWDLVKIKADPQKVFEWFASREGLGYDYLGIFGFVVRKVTGASNRYFCGEAACASTGMKDPWRFDPNTLHAALTAPAHE